MTNAFKILLFLLGVANLRVSAKHVVCYYGSWATYRAWPGKFDVSDINTAKCTHIVYAFAGLNAQTGQIQSLDPYNDLEENWGKGSYKKFAALAQSNPNLKALLAVGGWNEGSEKYSVMASTSVGRKRFAESVVNFLQQFGFGGLDLDWEYPTQRNGKPQDKENFVLLLKELYTQLHSHDLLLTIAVAGSLQIISQAYDIPNIVQYVDLINMMTFDYLTSSSSTVTGHAAPLNNSPYLSVEESVDSFVKAGCPKEKLVVGIPFYARTYTLASASNHGLGDRILGPGMAGPISQEPGYLTYYELCMKQKDEQWSIVQTSDGNVYSYKGNQWASYDDVNTIALKMKYVIDNDLGGAMIWPLESDDFAPVCQDTKGLLLNAVNEGLGR